MRGDWESWKKARVSESITSNTFSLVRPMLSSREYPNEFLIGTTLFPFHGPRWKFESRNPEREILELLGRTLVYSRIDTTNEFRLVRRFVNIFVSCPFTVYYTFVAYIRGIILICIRWAVPLGYVYPNFVCIQDGFLCQWKYGC